MGQIRHGSAATRSTCAAPHASMNAECAASGQWLFGSGVGANGAQRHSPDILGALLAGVGMALCLSCCKESGNRCCKARRRGWDRAAVIFCGLKP